jgi:hypothetical protein
MEFTNFCFFFGVLGNKDSAIYCVSIHALNCPFYFPQSAAYFTSLSLQKIHFFVKIGEKIKYLPLPRDTVESRILACNLRFKRSKCGMPVTPMNSQRKILNFSGQKAGMCNKPSKKNKN